MSVSSLADGSLVVFNFLPSRTLHPSRLGDYFGARYAAAMAAMPAFSGTWHRHWSRQILQQEGLLEAPVTDIAAAGVTIAVLDPGVLAALARRIGVVLCAPRLRYAISGEAVRALQAALGADVLCWARDGRTMHPGFPGPMFANADEAARTVNRAGYAALYSAFESAKPEVARRFFLKLPVLEYAEGSVGNEGKVELRDPLETATDNGAQRATSKDSRAAETIVDSGTTGSGATMISDSGATMIVDSGTTIAVDTGTTIAVHSDAATTVGGGAVTAVDSEVAMAIDSEAAMALATALVVNSTVWGGE